MHQIFCVLMATIAYGTAAAQAGAATITFQSSTYRDIPQILAREAASETVTVRATLSFPEQAR